MKHHYVLSVQKMDSSILVQLGTRSSKGDVGVYVPPPLPPSMLWAYQMYLELRAPNTCMIHNMIMHLLSRLIVFADRDDPSSPMSGSSN